MPHPNRLLALVLAAGLLVAATGCHYDYGYSYSSVGYSYGYSHGYDCAPRYTPRWDCDYTYYSHSPRYHAPCDGIRFRTQHHFGHGYTIGHDYHGR